MEDLVLETEAARKTYLEMKRGMLNLHGDGRQDLQAGEEEAWTWCPKRALLFDRVAARFPGFTWKPVTRAARKHDGSVVLRKFVRFTGFPCIGGRTLTAQELLTVDPQTTDLPSAKTQRPISTDWMKKRAQRRARGGEFVEL